METVATDILDLHRTDISGRGRQSNSAEGSQHLATTSELLILTEWDVTETFLSNYLISLRFKCMKQQVLWGKKFVKVT